ncbi:molybdopterin biosynthesis protein [Bradyrhizobiaceae bacterium SG-6C]|nr:molybdopterin biosynthesis protein [Bradyrhizobiaceae bacterium SG-6C]
MTQRLPAALTPLDAALRLLLDGIRPVEPMDGSLADSLGHLAAVNAPQREAHPAFSVAVSDGWALRASDIAGASSYSPVALTSVPVWVEAGDRLPERCDCVLDADMTEQIGPIFQVLAEAVPGQGVRRAGDDIAAGRSIVVQGTRIRPLDQLVARVAGINRLQVRSPRVCVIDVAATDGSTASSQFVLEFAESAGARTVGLQTKGRDAAAISALISKADCDLLVTVGGTGLGRGDAAIEALVTRGARLAHGLALQPGRTAAVGKIGTMAVIAAPGAPDQALSICLTLVQPALDLLTGRGPRHKVIRSLARKISSTVGMTEVVLLEQAGEAWMPIAAGQLSLDAMTSADAWMAVPGDSEGYAAGTPVGALSLREM